jgi:hypothetical protein
MPRFSVVVEITKDVVVDATDEDAAYDKVKTLMAKAQTRGDKQVQKEQSVDPLYSMDIPVIYPATETMEEYVSGSGDDHVTVAARKGAAR